MSDLKDIALNFQCKESWDKMPVCDGGKFCNVCKKTVYDFTNFSKEEYQDFLNSKTVPFCGNYKVEQTVYPAVKQNSFKLWAYRFLVLLGFSSCKEYAISLPPGKESESKSNNQTRGIPARLSYEIEIPKSKENYVKGEPIAAPLSDKSDSCFTICEMPPVPEYMFGGEEGMLAFLTKNMVVKDSVYGTVIVRFSADKNGKVFNTKIVKSLSPENDNEVLRVVNLLQFENSMDTVSFELPVIVSPQ